MNEGGNFRKGTSTITSSNEERHLLKVLSNGAGGGPKLVSIDPF